LPPAVVFPVDARETLIAAVRPSIFASGKAIGNFAGFLQCLGDIDGSNGQR